MTTRRYALSKGERRRLTLSWGIFYSNFTVRLDDQIIGTIPDQLSLNSGKGFQLEDGSQLFIYRESSQIKISRNGRPLPGSAADPQVKLNIAMGAIAFVCLASVFFGLVGGSTYNPQKSSLTIGIMIGSASLYGVLAFFVRSRSKIALGIAVGLYGLDTLGIIILLLGRTPGSYIVALGEHIL